MFRIKRVYEPAAPDDGLRVLVDRLWPRGLRREDARIDRWEKALAPSEELRRWFAHDPAKYTAFRTRYRSELSARALELRPLVEAGRSGPVTLLFAAKDPERCNATVLHERLEELARGSEGAHSPRGSGRGARRHER